MDDAPAQCMNCGHLLIEPNPRRCSECGSDAPLVRRPPHRAVATAASLASGGLVVASLMLLAYPTIVDGVMSAVCLGLAVACWLVVVRRAHSIGWSWPIGLAVPVFATFVFEVDLYVYSIWHVSLFR